MGHKVTKLIANLKSQKGSAGSASRHEDSDCRSTTETLEGKDRDPFLCLGSEHLHSAP